MKRSRYLTAREAAERLDINAGTLYSYVSRGLIRAEKVEGDSRQRRYRAEDVDRLRERKVQRKNPANVAKEALHWGAPIMESALTLITDNNLYYRGYSALELAATHTIEQVAALMWQDNFDDTEGLFKTPVSFEQSVVQLHPGLPYVPRLIQALAQAGVDDLNAYTLTPEQVTQTGARILRLMGCVVTGAHIADKPVAQLLNEKWCPDQDAVQLLNAVLILCADHELNASSFAARVTASAEALPYGVVIAGLAALQGFKHGGNTARVEAFLLENERAGVSSIAERLRRGERLPGFGHHLYPDGDPRATLLLSMLRQRGSAVLEPVDSLVQTVYERLELRPNIDLALVTLCKVLNLPSGAPLALFALGRSVGWIGHAIEQYQRGDLIRPRATYIGRPPR